MDGLGSFDSEAKARDDRMLKVMLHRVGRTVVMGNV